MPGQYPTAFPEEMIRRTLDGESVRALVAESVVPIHTLHRWKHQAQIDAGLAEAFQLGQRVITRGPRWWSAFHRLHRLHRPVTPVRDHFR